jgi:hypothetical protein
MLSAASALAGALWTPCFWCANYQVRHNATRTPTSTSCSLIWQRLTIR